jgi:hypothetical protein
MAEVLLGERAVRWYIDRNVAASTASLGVE